MRSPLLAALCLALPLLAPAASDHEPARALAELLAMVTIPPDAETVTHEILHSHVEWHDETRGPGRPRPADEQRNEAALEALLLLDGNPVVQVRDVIEHGPPRQAAAAAYLLSLWKPTGSDAAALRDVLIAASRHRDARVRAMARVALANPAIPTPGGSIPVLVAGLHDDDALARACAAMAIQALAPHARGEEPELPAGSLAWLVARIPERDWHLRKASLDALSVVRGGARALDRALRDPALDFPCHDLAAQALAPRTDPEAIAVVRGVIADAPKEQRQHVATALRVADPLLHQETFRMMARDADPVLRAAAVRSLVPPEADCAERLAILEGVLADTHELVRSEGVHWLRPGEACPADVRTAYGLTVGRLLRDESKGVRWAALRQAGDLPLRDEDLRVLVDVAVDYPFEPLDEYVDATYARVREHVLARCAAQPDASGCDRWLQRVGPR